MYHNEKIVGKVLQKWFKSGKLKREDVFITTKLLFGGLDVDKIEYFINESLSNLQLEYVDLYLIHFPVPYKFKEGEGSVLPLRDDKGQVLLGGRADHVAAWKVDSSASVL